MDSLSVKEMQELQKELHRVYEDDWGELTPDCAEECLLWTIGEVGEVIDVIKKKRLPDHYERLGRPFPFYRRGLRCADAPDRFPDLLGDHLRRDQRQLPCQAETESGTLEMTLLMKGFFFYADAL